MEIKNVYPPLKRKLNRRRKLRTACGWCFLAAAAACVIVNICVGGKAWSAVALWALWMIWSTLLTPVLVENNLISQSARLLINTCILLILIDLTISSGWAAFVIPIVCYGMLIAIGIIFFLNVSKQRQNMMPMPMGDRRSYRCCYLRHLWLFAAQLADHRTGLYCRCFTDCYHCDPTLTAVC